MKGIPILGSMILLAGAIALAAPTDPRKELVDSINSHLQKKFADIEATKEGKFGISRVEFTSIKSHGVSGAPGYSSKDFVSTIAIFGCEGKRLDAETVELRYHRSPGGTPAGMTSAFYSHPRPTAERPMRNEPLDTAKQWIKEYGTGKSAAIVRSVNGITYEARPVRLSKAECLSCHPGMKRNDPVAVIVIATAPIVKAK